ncbi:MAG: hypothetical protein OHK0017_07750 [Patescibacteria group bacterium]
MSELIIQSVFVDYTNPKIPEIQVAKSDGAVYKYPFRVNYKITRGDRKNILRESFKGEINTGKSSVTVQDMEAGISMQDKLVRLYYGISEQILDMIPAEDFDKLYELIDELDPLGSKSKETSNTSPSTNGDQSITSTQMETV